MACAHQSLPLCPSISVQKLEQMLAAYGIDLKTSPIWILMAWIYILVIKRFLKKRCSTRGRPYFGFTMGADYHIQRYFIGVEGEIGCRLNSKNSITSDTLPYFDLLDAANARETAITIYQKSTLRLGVIGKIGMEVFKNTSVYGLLGLNFQRMNYRAQINDNYNGGTELQSFYSAPSRASMRPGIVYGIGIQHKVHQNMSIGLEGRWTRLKAASYSIDNPAPDTYAAVVAVATPAFDSVPQGSEKLSGSYRH